MAIQDTVYIWTIALKKSSSFANLNKQKSLLVSLGYFIKWEKGNSFFSDPTFNSVISLSQSVKAFAVANNSLHKMMGVWLSFPKIFLSITTESTRNFYFSTFSITSSNFPYGSLIDPSTNYNSNIIHSRFPNLNLS